MLGWVENCINALPGAFLEKKPKVWSDKHTEINTLVIAGREIGIVQAVELWLKCFFGNALREGQ